MEIARCGPCQEDVLPRDGRALVLCGHCNQAVHLDCYRANPRNHICVYCAQPINEPPLDPLDGRIFYDVEVLNGSLAGTTLKIEGVGEPVESLMKKVALELVQLSDADLYYKLDLDASRVEISLREHPAQVLDVLATLPYTQRKLVARIRPDGWQDDLMEIKGDGENDERKELADFLRILSTSADVNGEEWHLNPKFGALVRLARDLALRDNSFGVALRGGGGGGEEDCGDFAGVVLDVVKDALSSGGRLKLGDLLEELRDYY